MLTINPSGIINFIRREKLYMFLLLFVVLFQLLFSLSNQLLEDSGLDKLFEEESFKDKGIISNEEITAIVNSSPVLSFVFFFLFIVFIFFALIGIIIDLIYLRLKNRKPPLEKTQIVESGKWSFWDIGKVAIIFLFTQRIIWLADIFLFSAIPYLQERVNLRLMLSATLADIIGIAAVLYFVVNEKRQDITALGLTAKRFFTNIKYGVLAYIGLVPILAAIMLLTTMLFKKFNIPIEPQPILVILREENHIPSLVYMGFFTAFLGPVLEEVFFRGFVYSVLKKKSGIFAGIVLSAAFFAYVHANLASFFPIFCLGLLLTYIYEKTGSLVSSITVHVIHNSITLIFLLFIKVITA